MATKTRRDGPATAATAADALGRKGVEVVDAALRAVQDGDLLVVTVPRGYMTAHPHPHRIADVVRGAVMDTARKVGIIVVEEGCTVEVAHGAAEAACLEAAAAAIARTNRRGRA